MNVIITAMSITIATPFSSGSVLQADQPLTIWGFASPNSTLQVSTKFQSIEIQADKTGHWSAFLEAQVAGQKTDLEVIGPNQQIVKSDNLIYGDLYLCSGQSNMEWTLGQIDGTQDRFSVTGDQVRYLRTAFDWNASPKPDVVGQWRNACGVDALDCSAVAFHFGHKIHQQTGRPVGLMINAIGGSLIETWIPKKVLLEMPEGQRRAEKLHHEHLNRLKEWQEHQNNLSTWLEHVQQQLDQGPGSSYDKMPVPPMILNFNQCSGAWNALLEPIRQLSLKGVLWYQGESNADHPEDYEALFKAMVQSWRSHFNQNELPFYWVQIAGFASHANEHDHDKLGVPIEINKAWVGLQRAQQACQDIPHTGMASAIHIGDRTNVHPYDKKTVGHHLAALALHDIYHQGPHLSCPTLLSAQRGHEEITLECDQELVTLDSTLAVGFHLQTTSGTWLPASGTTQGKTITIQCPKSTDVSKVSYAGRGWQQLNLCNNHGWPLLPAMFEI